MTPRDKITPYRVLRFYSGCPWLKVCEGDRVRDSGLIILKAALGLRWVSVSCLISELKKHIIMVLFDCQEFWVNLSFILTAT